MRHAAHDYVRMLKEVHALAVATSNDINWRMIYFRAKYLVCSIKGVNNSVSASNYFASSDIGKVIMNDHFRSMQ
jgi:hypothetical protein